MDPLLPLFPLNTVLFPGVVLPLRVFEERYRDLVRDLLALPGDADPEFGVVAIKVGYEVGEHGVHTVHRTGCTAVVTEVDAHDDGSYDIVVVGRRRFRVEALDAAGSYLRARVSWLADDSCDSDDTEQAARRLRDVFERYRAALLAMRGEDVLEGPTPTDPLDLSYTVAAAVVVGPGDRQRMLEARDTLSRLRVAAELVASELATMATLPSLPATQLATTGWHPN